MILCTNILEYIKIEILPALSINYDVNKILQKLCIAYGKHFEKVLIPNLHKLKIINQDLVALKDSPIIGVL